MNSKISDVALDLGVFALDNEIKKNSEAWDWIHTEYFAIAS